MKPTISIGTQSFEKIRTTNSFYIDKTDFIREWWENQDDVTLITRPRRFGKTLNLSMMECFFSNKYAGRTDLFQGLSIWSHPKYRDLQGTYPVITLSFANIKGRTFAEAREGIVQLLVSLYSSYTFLADEHFFNEKESEYFASVKLTMSDVTASLALNRLSAFLERYYSHKVLIFLDEYDTPLHEAYVYGYWKELTEFVRKIFNSTFKTNASLERALMTGITRVSKESIFSDLNNLEVVTTTSSKYCSSFGFTEEEVFKTLDERGFSDEKEEIRFWYDGFTFGNQTNIYNPWSITKFLDSGLYGLYWADTSSNKLVSQLIRQGTPQLKMQMEDLLNGKCLETEMDEQVIFEQLKSAKGAIWSLLVASGYLKSAGRQFIRETGKFIYQLRITNHEIHLMFRSMIAGWFPENDTSYNNFKEALLLGNLDYMNQFMNEVSEEMFSSFDVGRKPSEKTHPERFYHGFVLGLIVDLAGRYHIRSNRQSGIGRYDVMMEPKNSDDNAIIIEFKVFDRKKDKTLEGSAKNALKQIEKMKYDTELIARGVPKQRIRHYGFAFDGQAVLIKEG